jgi:hypothetical protein
MELTFTINNGIKTPTMTSVGGDREEGMNPKCRLFGHANRFEDSTVLPSRTDLATLVRITDHATNSVTQPDAT